MKRFSLKDVVIMFTCSFLLGFLFMLGIHVKQDYKAKRTLSAYEQRYAEVWRQSKDATKTSREALNQIKEQLVFIDELLAIIKAEGIHEKI